MAIPGVGNRPRPRAGLPRPRIPASWRQQPAAGGVAQAPEELADPFDFSTDPILQRIQALGNRRRAEAQAAAGAARRQAEADWTDVQARLGREQVERPKALTENLNKGNLFYSSEFGKQQSDLARSLVEEAGAAQSAHQRRLGDIEAGLRDEEEDIESDLIGAQESAADRLRERLGDLPLGGQRRPLGGAPRSRVAGMLQQRAAQGAPRMPGLSAGGLARRRPRARPRLGGLV